MVRILALALGVEAVTAFLRFGLGLAASRTAASTVGALTGGLRIHHGLIGLALLAAALILKRSSPGLARCLVIAGAALFLSDLAHHFLVLWPITGSPELDLFYPS